MHRERLSRNLSDSRLPMVRLGGWVAMMGLRGPGAGHP